MSKLPTYKGYTVDYRLRQFRRVHPGDCVCGGGEIEFIDFASKEGDALLAEMILENLVPRDVLGTLLYEEKPDKGLGESQNQLETN